MPPSQCAQPVSWRDGGAQAIQGRAKEREGEIIPQLLLSDPAGVACRRAKPLRNAPAFDDIQEFDGLILGLDYPRADLFSGRKGAKALSLKDVIGRAACCLGELWRTDHCSFTEVTAGLSCLRRMLGDFPPERGRRALLLATLGEEHTFSLFVVEAFFRREGWDVSGGQIDAGDEVAQRVDKQSFALAGFSLSSERFADRLGALIRVVRRHIVMVGDPVFLAQPGLAEQVEADAFAADGRMAVIGARSLLARKAAPS